MNRTTLKSSVAGLAICAGITLASLAGTAHAGATLTGENMQHGVHICLAAHYDRPQVLCVRDDAMVSLAGLHTTRLQFSSIGASFSAAKDIFKVWQLRSDGKAAFIGQAWADQNVAFGLEAFRLDAVLHAAGAKGTGVYEIEVMNGGKSLGMRLVSVVP